jgi:hypothetical protein
MVEATRRNLLLDCPDSSIRLFIAAIYYDFQQIPYSYPGLKKA